MNINPVSFRDYSIRNTNNIKNKLKNKQAENTMTLTSNYYPLISFGNKNVGLIEKIGRDNFPSKDIMTIIKNSPSSSLRAIHKEYYYNLESCSDLDEAKLIYPEFSDVISAETLDPNDFENFKLFKNLIEGKNPYIDAEDFSLQLLRDYYGNLTLSPKSVDDYYGFDRKSINKIMSVLNVPIMSDRYYDEVTGKNNND